MKNNYKKQVEILLNVIEMSVEDNRVALKGGTAINLFYRDLLRYSVDIDLCYLPVEERSTSFKNLHEIMKTIKYRIEKNFKYKVQSSNPMDGKKEVKLYVSDNDVEIKIEPNFIIRSCVFAPEIKEMCVKASKEFERDVSVRCLSFADSFGGKMCAALDRQHPRDFFDIKHLLEKEGITEDIKMAFLFYLISHNRPINELLEPHKIDITQLFLGEFKEMSQIDITLEEIENVRNKYFETIKNIFNEDQKRFLLGFIKNEPEWNLITASKIKDYPSVKWKMQNQDSMSKVKKEKYFEDLQKCLAN